MRYLNWGWLALTVFGILFLEAAKMTNEIIPAQRFREQDLLDRINEALESDTGKRKKLLDRQRGSTRTLQDRG